MFYVLVMGFDFLLLVGRVLGGGGGGGGLTEMTLH